MVSMHYYTTGLRNNLPEFACWGDLILRKFQNQFCACSAQPGQKCESGLMFNTKMPAVLRVRDYILARVTDTMFWYMIEESDQIWTLMISYFMQKDIDNEGMTSNDGGGSAMHATWPNQPYYRPSYPRGS